MLSHIYMFVCMCVCTQTHTHTTWDRRVSYVCILFHYQMRWNDRILCNPMAFIRSLWIFSSRSKSYLRFRPSMERWQRESQAYTSSAGLLRRDQALISAPAVPYVGGGMIGCLVFLQSVTLEWIKLFCAFSFIRL